MNATTRGALIACAIAVPLLAPAKAFGLGPYRPPKPVVKTLGNGLKVFVFPDPRLPVVEVMLRVPAGVSAEPKGQNGVASVAASLIGRGTTSRNAATFSEDLAQIATEISARTGREYATFSTGFLSRDFEIGLELFGDAVAHPVFLEEEFRRAVSQGVRAAAQSQADPFATTVEQLWTLALPDVPVTQPPLGRVELLGRLTLDHVRAFYRDRYRPDGAVLAIAGDVTPERAQAVAAEWLGNWIAGGAPPSPAVKGQPGPERIRIVDQPTGGGCSIAAGLVVPGHGAADALARSVAAGLFDRQVAERFARGPMRDARGSLELTRDHGLWIVQGAAPADSAAVIVRRLTAEWKRFLSAPPALPDVTAAQHRIRRSLPLAFETSASLLGQWLQADFAGFPADYFDTYGARVSALKPNDLLAAAKREAGADRPWVVVMGPASRLKPLLEPLGPVEVVTLERASGPAAVPDTLAPATPEQMASGRKLIAQALAAHGGLERLSLVKSSIVDARIQFLVPGSEVTGVMRTLRKQPQKLAVVTSVRGVDTRQVLNGDRAWTIVAENDSVVSGDSLDVASLRATYGSDFIGLLLAASGKGARVAARARERIAGRDADRVEVVTGADPWRMLYLDAANHRLVAFDQRERGSRGAQTTRRVYGDYRLVDGIQWPYLEERFVANRPLMKLDVTGVVLNVDLDEEHFEPPKKTLTPWR